ncbi:MAG: hypothetical protein GXP08_12080 [Gammaproteobacteria bacterium]|nr:hypothetical protein [Gammaproteobacteria bacterium]
MSDPQLQQLVKAYSDGQIARELYLVQRRELIDRAAGTDQRLVLSSKGPNNTAPEARSEMALGVLSSLFRQQPVFFTAFSIVVVLIVALLVVEITNVDVDEIRKTSDLAQADNETFESLLHRLDRSRVWDAALLSQWHEQWQQLSDEAKQELQLSSVWQRFEREVTSRFFKQQALAKRGDARAVEQTEQLYAITNAANISILTLAAEHAFQFTEQGSTDGVDMTLANANLAEVTPLITENQLTLPEHTLASVEQAGEMPAEPEPGLQDQAPFSPKNVITKTITKTQGESGNSASVQDNVWIDKSNAVLQQFSKAVQKGDVNTLVGMFADEGIFLKVKSKPYIKRTLDKMISTTDSRNLELQINQWKRDKNLMSGRGRYRFESRKVDAEEYQIVAADLRIKLLLAKEGTNKGAGKVNENDSVLSIVSFEVVNKDIISIPANLLADANVTLSLALTKVDLKNLVSRFVSYYEKGDLVRLIKLFSDNAETNGQNTIAGIRKDYKGLFNSTSRRQMFVENMQWETKGHFSEGESQFYVLVLPNKSAQEEIHKGRLKIRVEKNENGVFITQLFHELE